MGDNIHIPFVDLQSQYNSLKKDLQKAVDTVLTTSAFIKGPHVTEFEEKFAQYTGTKYCVSVASGTDALHLSLHALGVTSGDEVILPANTFAATAYAVLYCGARPVLVDVDKQTSNIDISLIKKAITQRTKVIIPVHLYGNPANMREIKKIAKEHKLAILEDACQAHGAWHGNKRAGNLGDLAAFSFYPGKNLGAYGDGGAITTNSQQLAIKLQKLREYGSLTKYKYDIVGFNSRLDGLQAAILNVKLPYLDTWNKKRQIAAAYYSNSITKHIPDVIVPSPESVNSVFHLYVIQVRRRERLQAYLNAHGIQTGIHYPVPLHLQKSLYQLGYKKGDFPVTETLSKHILSLPIFPEITHAQQDYVIKHIQDFYQKR